MDIYASGQEAPIRIDLFDDEIDSLKFFDPETQRTTSNLTQFKVLPAKEFPLKDGRSTFRDRYAESFPTANPKRILFIRMSWKVLHHRVLISICHYSLVNSQFKLKVCYRHTYLSIPLSLQIGFR